jgi:hypothetical protein
VKEFKSSRKLADFPIIIPAEGRDPSSRRSVFSSDYIALTERSSFVLRNDGPRPCVGVTGEQAALGYIHKFSARPAEPLPPADEPLVNQP